MSRKLANLSMLVSNFIAVESINAVATSVGYLWEVWRKASFSGPNQRSTLADSYGYEECISWYRLVRGLVGEYFDDQLLAGDI